MGISVKTLYNWRESYLPLLQSLKRGKEVIDYEVENALLNNALTGNITAQIFWLKNRRPDKWRDKVEEAQTHESKVTIINDLPSDDYDD